MSSSAARSDQSLNGEQSDMPSLGPPFHAYSLNHAPVAVPAGHIWLLGDFRDMSKDSRHFGPLPVAAMEGVITHFHLPDRHANAHVVR